MLPVLAPAGAITGSTRKRGCALLHHSRACVGFQLRSIASWAWLPDDSEGSNLQNHLVAKLSSSDIASGLPAASLKAGTCVSSVRCIHCRNVFNSRRADMFPNAEEVPQCGFPEKKSCLRLIVFFKGPTCSYRRKHIEMVILLWIGI